MKILHVCSNYYPAHGGPQYTMRHLSENFIRYFGDEVHVATSDSLYGPEMKIFEKIEPANETIHGVQVQRFPFSRWQYPFIDFTARAYKKIRKKTLPHLLLKYRWELACKGIDACMARCDADVIMATTASYMFADYPFWRAKTLQPKPFILYGALHLHINWPGNAPVIQRAKACDLYIANTDFEKEKLVGYGVSEKKIVTIGTGIDVQAYTCEPAQVAAFREKYQVQPGDILIGHVGRLSEGKGAGTVLDAFRALYKEMKQCKLLLAGTSTSFVKELQEKIVAEQLPVIILEDFENTLKPVLFHSIDVFVLASHGESFGVVFLEAWACKKPVVGMATGAVASLVSTGKDGLLFKQQDTADLTRILKSLASQPAMRQKMGDVGFKKITEQFSWPIITKKYRDAYLQGMENFKQMTMQKIS